MKTRSSHVELCYRVGAVGSKKKDGATQASIQGIIKVSYRPWKARHGPVLEKACYGPQQETTAVLPLQSSASHQSHPLAYPPMLDQDKTPPP